MISVKTKTKELFRKHDHRGVRTRISADKNTPRNTVVFLAHARLYFNAFILGTPSGLRICDIKRKGTGNLSIKSGSKFTIEQLI